MNSKAINGNFVTLAGERYYAIDNMDQMDPFFISVISNSDHWLFISSTGGLTAGRVSPNTPLFPYVTVDKIHDSYLHTGSKTLFRIKTNNDYLYWETFNKEHDDRYDITRNLYKNTLGNKLCFEEVNHDLQLTFRYTWLFSEQYGFVRISELINYGATPRNIELVDGLQNLLPAGTPRFTQINSSNLVDAYKWSEVDAQTGLACFTLFSAITDRAEPAESLKANTVFNLGLDNASVLLSAEQLKAFRQGQSINAEPHKRGIRGCYFVNSSFALSGQSSKSWQIVSNVEQTQTQVVNLASQLNDRSALANTIEQSIAHGSDELSRIMASGDAFQMTAEEEVSVHHYANVQFNLLRGGAVDNQYLINTSDFVDSIKHFNLDVFYRHQELLSGLPEQELFPRLLVLIKQANDPQLLRLCYEYLPIAFGRRHGDPSRPWNDFAIKLKDENDNRLLTYQGNWRDIFQNWEALTFSYPEFIENVITKFVNASTIDGYNPYRITKDGIDWEVEDEADPWSYIGYWGDHQIIYLEKLLELSQQFHPQRLNELLTKQIFSYANVPYRIKPFSDLVLNAKDTVLFDEELAQIIERRVEKIGADGKLLLDNNGDVYLVNLLEKLLVTLLAKLGNFVVEGGVWLNTQRPEWNDANNALVGQGLSMVTLSYLRRYVTFLQKLLVDQTSDVLLSKEVNQWLLKTAEAMNELEPLISGGKVNGNQLTDQQRYEQLEKLGNAACEYRQTIYKQQVFSGQQSQSVEVINNMLSNALAAIDHTMSVNERCDGLYNAYNLISFDQKSAQVDTLYPMLEGQVAALSSGTLSSEQSIKVFESLFASTVYRQDQQSFLLYPERKLPSFLEKNIVASDDVYGSTILRKMLTLDDRQIIEKDSNGTFRFNAEFKNVNDLIATIGALEERYGDEIIAEKEALIAIYESVFNHQQFTGRSGGMFGFEGLGCIYWHMVSKLLLAAEEVFFKAVENNEDTDVCHQLANYYYRVREGLSFNKTPKEYGAFPTDPYSHTPKHAGAQQPGMTGQVKEEILTRFAEFGIRVNNGSVSFTPYLLRQCEFLTDASEFRYLDVHSEWKTIGLSANQLAFTWCQIPFVYNLTQDNAAPVTVKFKDGSTQVIDSLALTTDLSADVFGKNGNISQVTINISPAKLHS